MRTNPSVCPRPTPAGVFEGVLTPRVSEPRARRQHFFESWKNKTPAVFFYLANPKP